MQDSPPKKSNENLSQIKFELRNLIGNCDRINISNQHLKK